MALINCKEPACTCQVDTSLACKEISSLFGLRTILEHHLENDGKLSFFKSGDLKTQLDFVNNKISKFEVPQQEEKFQLFKDTKHQKNKGIRPLTIEQLYIECNKGHRHYYDVDCKP